MMFMSINPNETIDDFKACGKEMVVGSDDNLKPFCYGCITSCMFIFHTYLNYIMG
jgi:hypothetical protein